MLILAFIIIHCLLYFVSDEIKIETSSFSFFVNHSSNFYKNFTTNLCKSCTGRGGGGEGEGRGREGGGEGRGGEGRGGERGKDERWEKRELAGRLSDNHGSTTT